MMTSVLIGIFAASTWLPGVTNNPGEADNAVCVNTDPPVYYAIDLVSTKRLPGTRQAVGTVDMTFGRSPFGVAINSDGHYVYDLSGHIQKLKPPRNGVYVAWLTTPNLKEVKLLGPLDASSMFKGQVEWQKFLVVVTLEESYDPEQARWEGPVALRGLSRSGLMHTMAGHGPFQSEPCAFYGYK